MGRAIVAFAGDSKQKESVLARFFGGTPPTNIRECAPLEALALLQRREVTHAIVPNSCDIPFGVVAKEYHVGLVLCQAIGGFGSHSPYFA